MAQRLERCCWTRRERDSITCWVIFSLPTQPAAFTQPPLLCALGTTHGFRMLRTWVTLSGLSIRTTRLPRVAQPFRWLAVFGSVTGQKLVMLHPSTDCTQPLILNGTEPRLPELMDYMNTTYIMFCIRGDLGERSSILDSTGSVRSAPSLLKRVESDSVTMYIMRPLLLT